MVNQKSKSRTCVALAAAFVLVLQSFATAWAAGSMPAGPLLDAFGNPLCVTGADQPDGDIGGSTPAGDHSKLPTCCTLGCSMVSPSIGTPADDAAAWLPADLDAARPDRITFTAIFVAVPDHDPGSPRAPPLTA